MKLRSLIAALAVAGLTGAAHASISFQFNPTGAGLGLGLINGAGILDQAPGDALGLNAVNGGGPLAAGTIVKDYYQANLGSVQTAGTANLFSNGGGGNYFTFVAEFTEVVISSSVGGFGDVTNNFVILGGTFKMCAQSALGNNLAGTGFACAGNGILSGTITSGFANQTGFPASLQLLDQSGADDWGGTRSVTSGGSATISATINSVNAGYFPDLLQGSLITTSLINSSLITPFGQIDPSRLFSSDTVADGDVAANIGAIDGISGPNFMFQADANTSFNRSVPEPGSLALVGLALAGLSALGRRRKAA